MNRRRFLELLGISTAVGTVAYSFPSVIVPKNIEVVAPWNMETQIGDALNHRYVTSGVVSAWTSTTYHWSQETAESLRQFYGPSVEELVAEAYARRKKLLHAAEKLASMRAI